MAATYQCAGCDITAESLVGWYSVVVGFFHDEATAGPLSGRVLDAATPQLLFHAVACRDAWATQAGVRPPAAPAEAPAA